MQSTMQDAPLLISDILRYGKAVHGDSQVITVEDGGHRSATFHEVAERAEKLAAALTRLGVEPGDRVGTFCWNNQGHLEAYLAIPSMGAVLHTLNIRLPADQLAYVINHAEDRFIIVDASLIPLLAAIKDDLKTVETIIVAGEGDTSALGETLSYERLLEAESAGYEWPELEERSAAAMCYTSGTTGSPKGVVYSHRSTYLHTMAEQSASSIGMTESDRILIIVPMFHANAWGTPYGAWLAGTDMIMPQMYLMGEQLAAIFNEFHPTIACGVPTIWNGLLQLESKVDMSSMRTITAGGAAVPESLIAAFEERFGVTIMQGWGMTETSPLAAVAIPPARKIEGHDDMYYKIKAGRVVAGVEVRIVAEDGTVLPNDGHSVGEFEIRGPWITGSYYKEEDPAKFHDGWLCTGDVGTQDHQGYLTISDRTKDVIKSGGEWISSVELENAVMGDPDVFEAAVIAIPDPKWSERPLVCVVPKPGRTPDPAELVEFMSSRVARWQLPEQWTFLEEIPKTSVGKFDKKVMRAAYANGDYKVVTVTLPK
ncbi:MAG TPA: long-chain fatty acid--CoA ligase [Acidimicrobiales bacterium]|jgi:fatty-acyl-CoA synthase|nr:long-chain fatty acid--CoA ligase [Acidimicrobiales bacterium]